MYRNTVPLRDDQQTVVKVHFEKGTGTYESGSVML